MVELLRRYSKLPIPSIPRQIERSERKPRPPSQPPRRISRRLSQENIAQLCADYHAGVTTRQLSDNYGIGKTTVTRLLRENGIQLRHQGLDATQISRAVELYQSGASVAQLASKLGVHASSAYDALRAAGVAFRTAHQSGRRRSPALPPPD